MAAGVCVRGVENWPFKEAVVHGRQYISPCLLNERLAGEPSGEIQVMRSEARNTRRAGRTGVFSLELGLGL